MASELQLTQELADERRRALVNLQLVAIEAAEMLAALARDPSKARDRAMLVRMCNRLAAEAGVSDRFGD